MPKVNKNSLLEAVELLILALLVLNASRIYMRQHINDTVISADDPHVVIQCQEDKKICLSFDDGPDPRYTPQLLDGLAKRGAKASFFLTGKNAERYPKLVKRIYDEGHLIGNHTYSHIQLTKSNRDSFKKELIRTNEIISGITGEEVVFVRPPYGTWDKSFEEELNMFPVLWNIDPLDWSRRDASRIVRDVISKARENAIILMHDEYPSTVKAALQIVDELQKQGYEFVTVEEIMFD